MKEQFEILNSSIKNQSDVIKSVQKELKKAMNYYQKADYQKVDLVLNSTELKEKMHKLQLNDKYQNLLDANKALISQARIKFEESFRLELQKINIHQLSGNIMESFSVKAMINVKVSFSKSHCVISTFSNRFKVNSLDPRTISKLVKKEIDRLFNRDFNPKDFIDKLFIAYKEVLKVLNQNGNLALLKGIHKQYWFNLQKDIFFETTDPSKMAPYALDQFSVDLQRLITSDTNTTTSGYVCKLSLGQPGINIYKSDKDFNSYKFIEFVKEGE